MQRHADVREEGELLPEWSNADATHSRAFKMQLKWEAVETLDAQAQAHTDGGMQVVPIKAFWAGVSI